MPDSSQASSSQPARVLFAAAVVAFLSLYLRLWSINSNPPGIFRDEARKAYSTYSLLKTGRDLTGRIWPLQIKEFTAYTTPFYQWFSIPFITTLGVTPVSARLLAALAGSFACLAVFLLGREWMDWRAGFWAALLLAISPWHLLFSRWANQGILMTLFIPAAVWSTWRVLEAARIRGHIAWAWILLASLAWGLAWNAYEPARLFVPLLLFTLIGIEVYSARTPAALVFVIGVLTMIWISPFIFDILTHWSETQARLAAIAGDEPFRPAMILINYLLHWNPVYLFWSGDQNPRHHISGQGQLCPLEGVLFLAGLFFLWKDRPSWWPWLLAWLLLSPVPAALTHEGLPHALRTLMIVPAIMLTAAFGLRSLFGLVPDSSRPMVRFVFRLALVLQLVYTGYRFFGPYRTESFLYWEGGFVEAIQTVEADRKAGEVCVISGLVEFPEATVEFVTLPEPKSVQAGEPLEGYRFVPTGRTLNPAEFKDEKLFLIRPDEIRIPPWWEGIEPDRENEAMVRAWRLYRSVR